MAIDNNYYSGNIASTGNILLNHTLVIHNFIISYDAANYHNIRLNVTIYWIIYAVVCCFRIGLVASWLPIVIVHSNRYWVFTQCWIKINIQKSQGIGRGFGVSNLSPLTVRQARLAPSNQKFFVRTAAHFVEARQPYVICVKKHSTLCDKADNL